MHSGKAESWFETVPAIYLACYPGPICLLVDSDTEAHCFLEGHPSSIGSLQKAVDNQRFQSDHRQQILIGETDHVDFTIYLGVGELDRPDLPIIKDEKEVIAVGVLETQVDEP